MADRSGIPMDALTIRLTKAHCQFLDRRQLFLSKPNFIIRANAVCHGLAENAMCAILAKVAIKPCILPGNIQGFMATFARMAHIAFSAKPWQTAFALMMKFGLLKNNCRLSKNWQCALVSLMVSASIGIPLLSAICG